MAHSKFPGVVLHDNLTRFVTIKGCEGRNHAVHVAIHWEGFHHFAAVGFKPAIVIMKLHSDHLAQDGIENAAGQNFVPWVITLLLVAGDNVETFM